MGVARVTDQADNVPLSYTQEMLRHHLRVWEVRKYCQAKPALFAKERSHDDLPHPEESAPEPDFALTTILRCLCQTLDADLAMVSLLDETTQYFLAGASKDNAMQARATVDSARWYGCDSVLHAGGLCARTIQLAPTPAVFEVLDMTTMFADGSLRHNDDLSRFRHYAGTPLVTPNGFTIGTVFVFRSQAAESALSREREHYLIETAVQVMKQLDQVVKSLEHERVAKFNGVIELLNNSRNAVVLPGHHPTDTPRAFSSRNSMSKRIIYDQAAHLLQHAFDFDGVLFQEIPLWEALNRPGRPSARSLLGNSHVDGIQVPVSFPYAILKGIVECWPDGEICYRAKDPNNHSSLVSAGLSPSTTHYDRELELCRDLAALLPDVQQVVLNPLWDPFHDRVVSIMVGFVHDWHRVYTRDHDLLQISASCMGVINNVRRQEAQRTEQQKADFIGSISHEMRSPLHGTLANLELLLATEPTEQQRAMLNDAMFSGEQLLDNINKILEYSQITADQSADSELSTFRDENRHHRDSVQGPEASPIEDDNEVTEANFAQETMDVIAAMLPRTEVQNGSDTQLSPRKFAGFDLDFSSDVPILFDTDHPRGRMTGYLSTFRKILTNLLSNAIRFTRTGCIRVSLDIDPKLQTMTLCISDTGIGISDEFLENRLFVPFMQQDQLQPGTGLGLCLVKQFLDAMNGTIVVDSSVDSGTTVTARMPFLSFQSEDGQGCLPRITAPAQIGVTHRTLQAHLFTTLKDDIPRDVRCRNLLTQSLTRTLNALGVQLQPWDAELPCDVAICLHNTAAETAVSRPRGVPELILCPVSCGAGVERNSERTHVLAGAILPSQVLVALQFLFSATSSNPSPSPPKQSHLPLRPLAPPESPRHVQIDATAGAAEQSTGQNTNRPPEHHPRPTGPTSIPRTPSSTLSSKPSLLLVDDNKINLKVLAAFSTKCPIASSTSAPSGQDAIDIYTRALAAAPPHTAAFDIIFMDLSMPDVSGFAATEATRRIEAAVPDVVPAHIVALTGLVGERDRVAALEAGVDEYLVKPAKLADIRRVVEEWRRRRGRGVRGEGG